MFIIKIYIDAIIFGATNNSLCEWFSNCMHSEFDMSLMGELNFFLGLQIKQIKEGIFNHQTKYVKELLKMFGYENIKPKATPMGTTIKLIADEKGTDLELTKYRGMIDCLLYLTAYRPDIMYSVFLCARFQAQPKESHLKAVKKNYVFKWNNRS